MAGLGQDLDVELIAARLGHFVDQAGEVAQVGHLGGVGAVRR